ncbi:FAD-binding monooxygenase moxY [Paramyrothecium foliicola]|nr:FAD-binding monooxygenase moxY [Paramyrothecium foliicola]
MDSYTTFRTDGYATNGVPRDSFYEIPDAILQAPSANKIRIVSVGAGISGIMNAYYIQKELHNVEHMIYEKNEDLGGTWLENKYPGCGCDIPSHAYSLPFAPNPDWPRFFSYSADIWAYLNKVCDVFNLRKYMNFRHEVVGCYWKEELGQWFVNVRQKLPDGTSRELEDHCHVLLLGTGILNNWKWPGDVQNLHEFKGRLIHTANWPANYQVDDWKKDQIAIIGSGASSIQTVPAMQPHAKHLHVFVRSPVWFSSIAMNHGHNYEYTEEQRDEFRSNLVHLMTHAKELENQVNGSFQVIYKNSETGKAMQRDLKKRMAEWITDKRLLEGLTPAWGVGCRRISPGDPYMLAIQKSNVSIHFTSVDKVTSNSVIGTDGIERRVDTIICATGFDVSYRPRFPVVGQAGVNLAEKWGVSPEGYMGLAIPGFPNLFTFAGPTFPVDNGGLIGPLSYVSSYVVQVLRKMQSEYVRSIVPKQDITDAFNRHCQEWIRHTIWSDDCRSWYKDARTGRVNAIWPGSSLHYCEAIKTPRYEDFDMTYMDAGGKNRFAYLGMGTAKATVEKGDLSPYLDVDHVDPKWSKSVGLDMEKVLWHKLDQVEQAWREKTGT